jgi:hypothetical protein
VVSGIQPTAPHLRPQPLPPRAAAAVEATWVRRAGQLGTGVVEFTGAQLCAACYLWKRKSEAVGAWYFSSTRLAAKKLLLISRLAVIGVLTCPLFGLCDCDVNIRTVVGDGAT